MQLLLSGLWVEDLMNGALDVKYFHIVFTIPEALNQICLLDSNLFYKSLFECVWSVLLQFGYTRYGVESGAICVLQTWGQNWNVHCEPPFGSAQQIVKYLGQYSHRVAISNHRIKNISDSGVTFFYKDYKDESRVKPTTLSGVEFLRRFCMHILLKRLVKIRY